MENNQNIPNQDKYLEKLVQENIELTKELKQSVDKINRWIAWQRVWTALKILIIVIPIVIGLIYLPPLLSSIFSQYQQLFFGFGDINQIVTPENINAE
jgi:hypothetical protein